MLQFQAELAVAREGTMVAREEQTAQRRRRHIEEREECSLLLSRRDASRDP